MTNPSHVSVHIKPSHYSRAFLIDNAGSLGDLSKLAPEYTSVSELTAFMTLKFTSIPPPPNTTLAVRPCG